MNGRYRSLVLECGQTAPGPKSVTASWGAHVCFWRKAAVVSRLLL